jgi:hypothetical protein
MISSILPERGIGAILPGRNLRRKNNQIGDLYSQQRL